MGTVAADDFYVGSCAAVAGGTTSFIDFVIPPRGESIVEAYQTWRKKADPKVVIDYALHCAITGWSEQIGKEMEILSTKHGIASYKFFLAYKNAFVIFFDYFSFLDGH